MNSNALRGGHRWRMVAALVVWTHASLSARVATAWAPRGMQLLRQSCHIATSSSFRTTRTTQRCRMSSDNNNNNSSNSNNSVEEVQAVKAAREARK